MPASAVSLVAFLGLPARASALASRVDALFITQLVVSGLMVGLLLALNLYFLYRYRRGAKVDRRPLEISEWKIETAWIVATLVTFIAFFFWGARLYVDEEKAPAVAYDIAVTGRQWMWDVRQPNGRREFNTLHVPSGRPVRLSLTSEDVIHSFYVPAFRMKQDVVPGKRVTLWFNATREGTYSLFCAEFCGTKHSAMIGEIVVQSPSDYAQWLASDATPQPDRLRGRELFAKYSCSGCHDQPSAIHAPSLVGVFGSSIPLDNGEFVRADETYLRDSILQPAKQVIAGYQPIMPSFQGVIPESDLLELIAYIETLNESTAPTAADAAHP
ncbi:MAG TPA: cytochrome c oxidase subunit II [Opitutaceae bacterium]|nr:cytochrome c oxidase subunit II [Opitutaceae bacterium]